MILVTFGRDSRQVNFDSCSLGEFNTERIEFKVILQCFGIGKSQIKFLILRIIADKVR